MPGTECSSMSNGELMNKISEISRYNQRAAWVLAQITDDEVFHAVIELRKRAMGEQALMVNESIIGEDGRFRNATTVQIDSRRWKAFWASRRLRMRDVSMMLGYDPNWSSVVAFKKKCSYSAIDRLAHEIGIPTTSLIYAVGDDNERQRVQAFG